MLFWCGDSLMARFVLVGPAESRFSELGRKKRDGVGINSGMTCPLSLPVLSGSIPGRPFGRRRDGLFGFVDSDLVTLDTIRREPRPVGIR